MEKNESKKLLPSLSGNPKIRICYGDKDLTKIIESLILLDLNDDISYNDKENSR